MTHLEVDDFLKQHFSKRFMQGREEANELFAAVEYSLFSGGKRFRPRLILEVASVLGLSLDKVLPWAAAVECIHTYSLIHDDLPCMDDDDVRRGNPTTHKKFNEATALLAGDGLLTEAFYILAHYFVNQPEVARELTLSLANSAGLTGMIAGQHLDLINANSPQKVSVNTVQKIHSLKTAELITISIVGVCQIARLSPQEIDSYKKFGLNLGLAFQLADDLLDGDQSELNLVHVLGATQVRSQLSEKTQNAKQFLSDRNIISSGLSNLLSENLNRAAEGAGPY